MLLIKNGYIKTMAGADLENGCVLIGDDGKIVAVGSHKELYASCDAYRTMVDLQRLDDETRDGQEVTENV